ncbi:uncharacterized protein B0H18DRAFT_957897 [Fomitopsis serialis]|uniref:uncharacterized protein n=1 Tax=Fomitopsis serialis TaxID=139415 RepID=UPI0020073238|nr:uncharacterized protein B0H18DRAFT_957897 [Neoantrodia serialis]KAH9918493.1 hypothetical protein B0H18DRAFT_957897 [Neoantrodia serialis]
MSSNDSAHPRLSGYALLASVHFKVSGMNFPYWQRRKVDKCADSFYTEKAKKFFKAYGIKLNKATCCFVSGPSARLKDSVSSCAIRKVLAAAVDKYQSLPWDEEYHRANHVSQAPGSLIMHSRDSVMFSNLVPILLPLKAPVPEEDSGIQLPKRPASPTLDEPSGPKRRRTDPATHNPEPKAPEDTHARVQLATQGGRPSLKSTPLFYPSDTESIFGSSPVLGLKSSAWDLGYLATPTGVSAQTQQGEQGGLAEKENKPVAGSSRSGSYSTNGRGRGAARGLKILGMLHTERLFDVPQMTATTGDSKGGPAPSGSSTVFGTPKGLMASSSLRLNSTSSTLAGTDAVALTGEGNAVLGAAISGSVSSSMDTTARSSVPSHALSETKTLQGRLAARGNDVNDASSAPKSNEPMSNSVKQGGEEGERSEWAIRMQRLDVSARM